MNEPAPTALCECGRIYNAHGKADHAFRPWLTPETMKALRDSTWARPWTTHLSADALRDMIDSLARAEARLAAVRALAGAWKRDADELRRGQYRSATLEDCVEALLSALAGDAGKDPTR